jgi:hypothetical protein
MPKESPAQQKTVERVMHEFKHGELKTANGQRKVKSRKQAVAIALNEAGASKYETPKKNAENLRHTKAKEKRGGTYKDEAEGHRGRKAGGRSESQTRDELYAEAQRRDVAGRSKMNRQELQRALHA